MFPRAIQDLVEKFREHGESYKNAQYKEAQLREEFINPFWWELGWDMTNRAGLAEAYKEVIHEDSLRIEGAMKAPDYTFRVGSEKKFFLEVKAPKVHLATDVAPAYQLKRYAWSAGLSISLLSDFEEFAVYQTTSVPKPTDAPYRDRIEFFNFEQYEEKWDWLVETFSREAIWKGRFDKYAAQAKGKRGTTPFDKQFLTDMVLWRKDLAENIALRNKGLSETELNSAVQITLDRIIMLRICEDRKIEQYGNLAIDAGLNYVLGLNSPSYEAKRNRRGLGGGPGVYENLLNRFKLADDRFNSGLFHFKKEKDRDGFDTLTPRLAIDDKVLTGIIKHLYYPESPYAFDIVPSDILGHVYEQFLGQVITLTKGGYARVEEKPEVKKAGGVYYTPTYIVDYIVKNTVGKLLETRVDGTAGSVKKKGAALDSTLKILDPACGSGSFLLGAYQYLLDWYLKFYLGNDPEAWAKKKALDRIPTADPKKKDYRLSARERKRILLDHIHGVDIDRNAVEVAKLNLMLKVLEGGTSADGTQRIAYDTAERLLPDLDKNIICGNSLIGTDYFDQQETEPDMAQRAKINAMDWKQAFPDIMRKGGFDVVIGNPPWGALFDEVQKQYLVRKFTIVPSKTKDSYLYFLFNALILTRKDGLVGLLLPNTWLLINNANEIRKELLGHKLIEIVDHGDGVFEKAIVEASTLVMQNRREPDGSVLARREKRRTAIIEQIVPKDLWLSDPLNRIVIERSAESANLLKRLEQNSEPFGKSCEIIFGIKPYQVGYGTPSQTRKMVDERIYHANRRLGADWKPLLVGGDVNRYSVHYASDQWIKYGKWLMYTSNEEKMKGPKIFLRRTSDTLRVAYEPKGYYGQNSLFVVTSTKFDLRYLSALLNSKLMDYVYKAKCPQVGKIFAEIKPSIVKELPLHLISTQQDRNLETKVVAKVESIMALNQQSSAPSTDRTHLTRQIVGVDAEIDKLVYQLYGLSEEEIRIVEGTT